MQVVASAVTAVKHLKSLGCDDIEFSPEDAGGCSRCVCTHASSMCQRYVSAVCVSSMCQRYVSVACVSSMCQWHVSADRQSVSAVSTAMHVQASHLCGFLMPTLRPRISQSTDTQNTSRFTTHAQPATITNHALDKAQPRRGHQGRGHHTTPSAHFTLHHTLPLCSGTPPPFSTAGCR